VLHSTITFMFWHIVTFLQILLSYVCMHYVCMYIFSKIKQQTANIKLISFYKQINKWHLKYAANSIKFAITLVGILTFWGISPRTISRLRSTGNSTRPVFGLFVSCLPVSAAAVGQSSCNRIYLASHQTYRLIWCFTWFYHTVHKWPRVPFLQHQN